MMRVFNKEHSARLITDQAIPHFWCTCQIYDDQMHGRCCKKHRGAKYLDHENSGHGLVRWMMNADIASQIATTFQVMIAVHTNNPVLFMMR